MSEVVIDPCPECRQGKHLNCTVMVMDEQDDMVPCPCDQSSHR